MKKFTILGLLLTSPLALAGDWGEPWGRLSWSVVTAAVPVPVDSALMIIAATAAVIVAGILNLSKKGKRVRGAKGVKKV